MPVDGCFHPSRAHVPFAKGQVCPIDFRRAIGRSEGIKRFGRLIEPGVGLASGLRSGLRSVSRRLFCGAIDPASDFILLQGCGPAACGQSKRQRAVRIVSPPGHVLRGPHPLVGFRRPSCADLLVTCTG